MTHLEDDCEKKKKYIFKLQLDMRRLSLSGTAVGTNRTLNCTFPRFLLLLGGVFVLPLFVKAEPPDGMSGVSSVSDQ